MAVSGVIHAGQLVTLAGPSRPRVGTEMCELGIIEDGAFVTEGGVITWVGKTDDFPSDTATIDAEGCLVMPGFVDAHTHPVFAGSRVDDFEMRCRGATYSEVAAAGGGIMSTVAKTRAASEKELLISAIQHVNWMISCGTTTIEAKSGYGLSLESELTMLRVIGKLAKETGVTVVPTFLGAHGFPPEYKGREAEYVALITNEMLPAVAAEGLAVNCDIFCEKGYFSCDQAREILVAAKNLGLGLKVHADQLSLSGGAQLAAELGAVTADHLEQTDANGIAAMKAAGVIPVLLPGSVFGLGLDKYPDARGMIDAGLPVVIATDFNPGSSPTPSIPMAMFLACTKMKMTPAECVTASTVNAAYSLGLGDLVGSLEVGKRADFVVYDCKDYRELANFFGFSQAKGVYTKGNLRYGQQ